MISFHKFITYCFGNAYAKLFLPFCTSAFVNSFHHLISYCPCDATVHNISIILFLLYHNQFSLKSATFLLLSARAGFSTLAPVILKKLGVNC